MEKNLVRDKCHQEAHGNATGNKLSSPYTTPLALFTLGLQLLTPEQRHQFWEYLVVTDYGTRYIPPEKQPHLLKLLRELLEEERLSELDFFARLREFEKIKGRILREAGPYLALFQ
jgi:hypothetical protein